jgi:diamine N-acetyltransferase
MDSHEPDFIVVGEKVALGPLRRDLAAAYARWMNQLEVRRGLDHLGVATPHSQEKWVEENIESGAKREPQAVEFTVYDRTDSTPVGTAGLLEIAHANGTAEFAIAIGERRGQGLGTEATRLVLDFAFHVLQLRNVLLETLE